MVRLGGLGYKNKEKLTPKTKSATYTFVGNCKVLETKLNMSNAKENANQLPVQQLDSTQAKCSFSFGRKQNCEFK